MEKQPQQNIRLLTRQKLCLVVYRYNRNNCMMNSKWRDYTNNETRVGRKSSNALRAAAADTALQQNFEQLRTLIP